MEELRAFLVVVDEGSFLSAAVALGVSRTTLRRQVDALEAAAGVPLLQRNRTGVVLTEAGRQLAQRGRAMEQEFTSLLHSVRETGQRPTGGVRVLLPIGLPPAALAALYGLVRANWPGVLMTVRFREAPLTANLSEVDVVVWFGEPKPTGAWESHLISVIRQRLLAKGAYLAERGTPRSVEELAGHDLLAWIAPEEAAPRLFTVSGTPMPLQPKLVSTNVDLLHDCARLGLGIVWAPDANLVPVLDREPLVPVLADVIGRDVPLFIAVPRALADVPKVRIFIDHLASIKEMVFAAPPTR